MHEAGGNDSANAEFIMLRYKDPLSPRRTQNQRPQKDGPAGATALPGVFSLHQVATR